MTRRTLHGPISGKLQSPGPTATSGRPLLTANTTYFFNDTLGNDSNDGLSTGAGAFQTIERAIQAIASVDTGDSTLSHTLKAETNWTQATTIVLPKLVGAASVTIEGDPTTPSNITITDNAAGSLFSCIVNETWNIDGFRIENSDVCFNGENSSVINVGNIEGIEFDLRLGIVTNNAAINVVNDIFVESTIANELLFSSRFATFVVDADINFGPTCTFSTAIFRPRFSAFGRLATATFSGTTGSGLGNTARIDQFSILDTASGSLAGLPGNGTNTGTGGAIV